MAIISIIVAMTPEGVIGRKGAEEILWDIPSDRKMFRKITASNPLIMGWHTFYAIYKATSQPLPGRKNIVLTTSHTEEVRRLGGIPASTIDEALALAGDTEVFVIGGEEVYRQFIELAHNIHLTTVYARLPKSTEYACFPAFDKSLYKVDITSPHNQVAGDEYPTSFALYQRKTPPST